MYEKKTSYTVDHPDKMDYQPVFSLACAPCGRPLTDFGVAGFLLHPPGPRVPMLSACIVTENVAPLTLVPYATTVCGCVIMDTGCTGCGTVLGYYVQTICCLCVNAAHNGNRYVFQPNVLAYKENKHFLKRFGRGFLDLTPRDRPGR